jgi:hypothetical protein
VGERAARREADIEACWPSKIQGAYQRRGSRTRLAVSVMMKMVEPYISIMSPGSSTRPRALPLQHRWCRR